MGKSLAGVGGIIGGFCAGFLAYIAVGGAVALAIAGPYNVDQNCWPHYTLFGIVRTECASTVADAAWYVAIETPRYLVVMPTLALAQLILVVRTDSIFWLRDAVAWGQYGVPIIMAAAFGFFHLRTRMPLLAWALLALLLGQIAVGVAPNLKPDLVEPMAFLFPALRTRRLRSKGSE